MLVWPRTSVHSFVGEDSGWGSAVSGPPVAEGPLGFVVQLCGSCVTLFCISNKAACGNLLWTDTQMDYGRDSAA